MDMMSGKNKKYFQGLLSKYSFIIVFKYQGLEINGATLTQTNMKSIHLELQHFGTLVITRQHCMMFRQ
jgi:hypothetical protein